MHLKLHIFPVVIPCYKFPSCGIAKGIRIGAPGPTIIFNSCFVNENDIFQWVTQAFSEKEIPSCPNRPELNLRPSDY